MQYIFPRDIKNETTALLKKKRQLSQEYHDIQKMNLENPKQIFKSDKENAPDIKLD